MDSDLISSVVDGAKPDAHGSDPRFIDYYARESATARAYDRAKRLMDLVMRVRRERGLPTETLTVADVGCNAGTQSRCWLEHGHQIKGIDISRELIELAQERNSDYADRADFRVGTATDMPWSDSSCDVCLLPELLEHVEDWSACLSEAVRLLRPGGTLYISTSNFLCPVQVEFNLPAYSWYPKPLKDWVVRRVLTDSPGLANYATYPAINWFSPYQLRRHLNRLQLKVLDRFDVIDRSKPSRLRNMALWCIDRSSVFRLVGHVFSPATVVIGIKQSGPGAVV